MARANFTHELNDDDPIEEFPRNEGFLNCFRKSINFDRCFDDHFIHSPSREVVCTI